MFNLYEVQQLFPNELIKRGNNYFTLCPFPDHNEKTPSFTVRLDKGTYSCYGCHKYGKIVDLPKLLGKNVQFMQFTHSFSNNEVKEDKVIDNDIVTSLSKILWSNENLLDVLRTRIPNDDIIKEFRLGYSPTTARYSFPIFEDGVCRNIKLMSFSKTTQFKQVNWDTGYGTPRLYGREALSSDKIIICAGEWDKLVNNSFGFPAITGTAGEMCWLPEWNRLFLGKKVYLVFDQDDTGRKAREKVARELIDFAYFVRIVDFDIDMGKGGDVSNYFLKFKKSREDYLKCLNTASFFNSIEESANPIVPFKYSVKNL
jgi:DNA primase